MSNPDVDLESESKIVASTSIICNHCQNNIAEIFQEKIQKTINRYHSQTICV
jgi:hypothetical protein